MYIRKRRLNGVNPLGYYYTYSKNKKYKATTFFVIIFRHLNIKIFFLKGKCKKKIPFVSLSTKGGKWFASCSTHLKPKKCELQMKCITCKKKSIRCFYFIFFFLHILELYAGFLFWNIEVPRTRALCNLPR